MSALITVPDLRQHVETDLSDPAVQRLINDAEAAIADRYGAHKGSVVQEFYPKAVSPLIFPPRRVGTVTQIVDYTGILNDAEVATTLAANDYRVELDGRRIRRLSNGSNAATVWGDRVEVTAVPVADGYRRGRVVIDLVRLAIANTGLQSERAGDYSSQALSYQRERNRILGELRGESAGFA